MKSPKSQLKYNIRPNPRKVIRGARWLISTNPEENILSLFRKVYYIQSTDEQIKKRVLTQMSKKLHFATNVYTRTNQKKKIIKIKEGRKYTRHLSASIH